jgi:hypothetical protein
MSLVTREARELAARANDVRMSVYGGVIWIPGGLTSLL